LEALGGRDAFASVESVLVEQTATLYQEADTVQAQARYAWTAPHTLRRINVLGDSTRIAYVVQDGQVWFQGPDADALAPASPGAQAYFRAGYWRTLPVLLAHAARGTRGLTAVEHARTTDAIVWHIESPGGHAFRLHVEADTGRPIKRVFQRQGARVEDVFSAYRAVGGLQLPHRVVSFAEGRRSEDVSTTRVTLNPSSIPAAVPSVPQTSTH
jgi:hypothetical protein